MGVCTYYIFLNSHSVRFHKSDVYGLESIYEKHIRILYIPTKLQRTLEYAILLEHGNHFMFSNWN